MYTCVTQASFVHFEIEQNRPQTDKKASMSFNISKKHKKTSFLSFFFLFFSFRSCLSCFGACDLFTNIYLSSESQLTETHHSHRWQRGCQVFFLSCNLRGIDRKPVRPHQVLLWFCFVSIINENRQQ